jgi:hypothetical protein
MSLDFGKKDESGQGQQPMQSAGLETGAIQDVGSIEAQASQRRLARLSKYFTTPTGVLGGETTGSAGVF